MSTNFMYIPETVIFIKSAKLDAQKHWQITVEMKSFILIAGLWQGLFACQRQIRTKRWRIHKSYFLFSITWQNGRHSPEWWEIICSGKFHWENQYLRIFLYLHKSWAVASWSWSTCTEIDSPRTLVNLLLSSP